jgi:membrane-associated phospholipid phosphatase
MAAHLQARARRGRARDRRTKDAVGRPHPVGDWKAVTLRLAAGLVGLWGLLSLIGLAVTHLLLHSAGFRTADLSVDKWFAGHRTGALNVVTYIGTTMAQTTTAIGVTVVVVLLLRWRLGRWHESGIFITVMAGELLIFLAITATIHEPRPQVARLDVAPPTSSFPSGHTAAALALYGGIAVMVFWIYGRTTVTRIVVGVLFCVPVYVGLSRLYRGMHYPSDVLAGALLGGLWLLLVTKTLLRPATAARPRAARAERAKARPGLARRGAAAVTPRARRS